MNVESPFLESHGYYNLYYIYLIKFINYTSSVEVQKEIYLEKENWTLNADAKQTKAEFMSIAVSKIRAVAQSWQAARAPPRGERHGHLHVRSPLSNKLTHSAPSNKQNHRFLDSRGGNKLGPPLYLTKRWATRRRSRGGELHEEGYTASVRVGFNWNAETIKLLVYN